MQAEKIKWKAIRNKKKKPRKIQAQIESLKHLKKKITFKKK
jgi:hypothetical protein